ncbi:MAG: hypothetical protein JJE05_04585 [Actinobacteria bacterium]|nr:hypothetical protein [Actinomycetota bacterium]
MFKTSTKMFGVAVAATLLLGACGSDGTEPRAASNAPDAAGSSTVTEADLQSFCDAVVGAKSALIAASEGSPAENPSPLMEAAESNAPDEIAENLGSLFDTARAAIETGNTKAFRSERFQRIDESVDAYVAGNCRSEKLNVTGVDFGFGALPSSVSAGRVTIDFENTGEELHEMVLMRIDEEGIGVGELLQMPEKKALEKLTFVRALFALPGESDVETFDLETGEYAVVCLLPVGSTSLEAAESAKGPPHAEEGMAAQLTVE